MSNTVIETLGLRKEFGDHVALKGVDLQVNRGEVVGLLGPNGVGKSTLVKVLTTLIAPTSGIARVAGFDVVREPMEVKRRIGYVPESAPLFDALTGAEFLRMVIDLKTLSSRESYRRALELAGVFGVDAALEKQLGAYSKGMRQKVLIIAALVGDPEVLILDEPVDGLDPLAAAVLKSLLRQLAAQRKAVLFCSHVLDAVEQICDRVYVLADGTIVTSGTTSQITEDAGAATLEDAFLRLTAKARAAELTSTALAALR